MLTTRRDRQKRPSILDRTLRFEILDDGEPIGTLGYEMSRERAELALRGRSYSVEYVPSRRVEPIYKLLLRLAAGGDKPPPNPSLLRDADGRELASATRATRGFLIRRGDENFALRKPSLFSRPYHLYREGSRESLGSVGQQRFFTTKLHMDLPREFDAAFQVFLLVLLLNLTMENLESSGGYG